MNHFKQAFALCFKSEPGCIVHLAAAALGHPVDEIEHIRPAAGGEFFVVFALKQVLFVADVLEPVAQKLSCSLKTRGMPRAVFQIVHIATKLVQTANRSRIDRCRQ